MAPTLQEFNKSTVSNQTLRMQAFQPATKPSPAANQETISALASYGAALDLGGQIDSVYKSISNQLSYSSSSMTLDSILGKWRQNDIQGSMDTLRSVLADPNVDDATKTNVLYGFQTGQQLRPLSYNVAQSALMANDDGESVEQEDMRIRLAQSLDEVNQYNSWAQQIINALNSETDPTFITNTKKMVESFLPFADAVDQAFFNSLIEGIDAGSAAQTLLLLGEGRERIRNTLLAMPVEERQATIQGLVNTIRSSKGIIGGETQTLRSIENLQRAIVPGTYGDTEKWVDNILSLMDDTILLTPFSKSVRGLGGLLRAGDAANVSTEVIARAERSANALPPLPRNQSLAIINEPAIAAPNIIGDIDTIIDDLPVEATSTEINSLRSAITKQLDNPNGFDIDSVINESLVTDRLTSTQVLDIRQAIGRIRDKRTAYINSKVEPTPPSISEPQARFVSSNVQPGTVSQIYKDTNVSKARIAHNAVLADESGQAARIMYGTDRDSALAHDYGPEIGNPNGRVQNKIEYDEAAATPDTSIIKHVRDSEGAAWADAAEQATARKAVINDWKNTIGVSNRSAMSQVSHLNPSISEGASGVNLNQVYGPQNGGFSNAYTGMDVVRSALRKYGVTDDEITVLSRQSDGTYAPVKAGTNLSNGDFLVQVNYNYAYDPKEVSFTGYNVSKLWGFLPIPDVRIMNKEGGLLQQFIPKSVNIDPRAYVPGVAASDRAAGIQRQFLKSAKQFANDWKKLDKVQQGKVDKYIRDANANETPFSVANIRSKGISEDGVKVLSQWKTLQDTIGDLENMDMARTLNGRGYEMLEHPASDTRAIVQRVPKSNIPNNAEIYDVATDTFLVFSQKNIDDLYEGGAYIVQGRRPFDINGRQVDLILAANNGTGAYARRIRDTDRIMNYRHGYYHVRYEDPYYITKFDPETKRTTTIASAGSNRDARVAAQRLNDTKDGFTYGFKRDRAATNDQQFDDNLDVAINYGRSAQRLRGKRLERVKGADDKGVSEAALESPIDSLTRSISSISHRVSFRNVIDAEKRRWMSQWKNLVKTGEGGPKFPNSVDEIMDGPGADAARHAFRHVEALQDGYGNMIDEMTKGFFNKVSDVAGQQGWGWADKLAAKAAQGSITQVGRMTAFRLFLASNPLRQLPLQAIPALPIVSSLNPLAWPKVVKQLGIIGAWHRGIDLTATEKIAKYGLNMKETRDMLEAYELSGVSAAVNAHSYIADDMARLADRNVVQRAATFLGKPLKVAQQVGFDLGEQTLISTVWLSEYDRLTRKLGRTKLTATERDQLMGKVRALTGDMNRGGDLPYNSNSFSTIMQFMQAPHKIASGLILGHAGLTGSERARLAAGYITAFGIPAVPIIDQFIDKMIPVDNPEARDIVKGGLTNMVLNNMLSSMSGTKVNTDFSGSLQPFSLEPLVEFAGSLVTLNAQDFFADTASGSLITGSGRVSNFAKAVVSWLIPGEVADINETKQVGLTFLQMFSGLSNYMKAQHIIDTGRITTSTGQVVDEDVSYTEAMLKAAGFQTLDEVHYWAAQKVKWELDGGIQRDIETLVDDLFTKYVREGEDPAAMEQYTSVLRQAAKQFNNNTDYLERVKDYMQFKFRQNPNALYRLMLNSGIYKPEDVVRVINNSGFTQEQRENLMEMYKIAGDSYGG